MRIRSRLKTLMSEKHFTTAMLAQDHNISREAIANLRKDDWQGVSKPTFARLCAALRVGPGELFETVPDDIWEPIVDSGEVTIHIGKRNVQLSQAGLGDSERQEIVGSWDLLAYECILEFMHRMHPHTTVHLQVAPTASKRPAPKLDAKMCDIFPAGNHIVIGSSVANELAESVICAAYKTQPHQPPKTLEEAAMPLVFNWGRRHVESSFGLQRKDCKPGIWSKKRNLIAEVVQPTNSNVNGRDCALVVTLQEREATSNAARVVIALVGYGGPGTLAAARILVDNAPPLQLSSSPAPRMWGVQATYVRDGAGDHDPRVLQEQRLLPSESEETT